MSAKANRRRSRIPPVKVKVAFGNDDDEENNARQNQQELVDERNSTVFNQTNERNNTDEELNRSFQQTFFTIQNITVEITLEKDVLSWSTVAGNEASRRNTQSSVKLQDVFAISPIYTHWNWSSNKTENIVGTTVSTANTITSSVPSSPTTTLSETSVLRGFQLHSYQTLTDNILQEIWIVFQSTDSNQIERWFHFLKKILSEYQPKRHIFVICNPYSGGRHGRDTYNMKIKTLLELVQYKITYTEIGHECSADEALQNIDDDFDSIDSLVIIGGDGSVINVINALIRYLAKTNRTKLDTENDLPSIPFPICIIPDGTTNLISHTIQGNTDHCTPLFHLISNQRMKIDMSAIFDSDYQFVTTNFTAGAGYPANVLKYFPRYSHRRPRTGIKKSFAKAALNKNLQPLEVEIRYIPADENDLLNSRCFRGCPSCTQPGDEKSDDRVKIFDDSHIQKMHQERKSSASINGHHHRLASAGKSSNEKEKNWKSLQQEVLQVAVFTNASLWSFAPQGLAKFGHLADGLLDLVVIEPVARKEFLRYIRRNGNSKNQYDLPFTKLIKVKEIEIELKFSHDKFFYEISNTDNQLDSSPSDDSSNEDMSDNEITPSGLQKHQPRPPSAPISEDTLRNRQHRRRRINPLTQESSSHVFQSSKSMDATMVQSKFRSQQSENETDSPLANPYGSITSLRRSGTFQSLKFKKDRVPLPQTGSVRRRDTDDERQQRKNRRTLRPARSLLSLLTNGSFSGEKNEQASTISMRDSFSTGSGRRLSVMSRSSSAIETSKTSDQRKKRPCMWNLDFNPYNSPLIRMKCLYRYLSVYGVSLDPDTQIREVNYSCFGRLG